MISIKIKSIIKRKPILSYSIISLIGCLLLNIGIFNDYAFLDANEYIWTAYRDVNFQNEFIQGGRPLLGVICEFLYGTICNTITDLKWVRLFSVIGSVLFSVQIFSFLLKLKMKIYESALFSFLILTIPSFSVYYSWSATSEIPIILNLNFFAGVILIQALEKNKKTVLKFFGSLIIVIVSLCIYQSAVTVFLIPFVFSFVLTKNFSVKKAISILIFIGISFSIYFIIFKLSIELYGLKPSNRTNVNLIKLPVRVILFYFREVRMLLKSSGILIWPIAFMLIGTFSFLGFFYSIYQKRKETTQFFFFISWLILVLPLTYLPNLISSDNYVCSRTIAPAAILILFYQFNFWQNLSAKNKKIKRLSLILGVLVIALSSINLNFYMTRIHSKEHRALKSAFNKIPIDNTKRIIFIKPKNEFLQEFNFYKQESADEFGHISSSRVWVPKPLFNQLLKERLDSLGLNSLPFPTNKIEVYDLEAEYNDDNSIVINLIDILKDEFSED